MSLIFTIYALKLISDKYYIGKTTKPVQERFLEHIHQTGSEWTKLYEPVEIVEHFETSDVYDEDKYTKKYMGLYGIANVRGGSYCNITLMDWQIKSLEHEIKGSIDSYRESYNASKLYVDYLNKFDSMEKIKQEIKLLESDLELTKILVENIQITKYLFDYKSYIDINVNIKQFNNRQNEELNKYRFNKNYDYEKKVINKRIARNRISEISRFIINENLYMNQEHRVLISGKIKDVYNDETIDPDNPIDEYLNNLPNLFEITKNLINHKQLDKSNLFLLLKMFIRDPMSNSNPINSLNKNIAILQSNNNYDFANIINFNLLKELELYSDITEQNYSIIIYKIYLFRRGNEIELDNLLKKYSKDLTSFESEIYKKINLLLEKQIEFVN